MKWGVIPAIALVVAGIAAIAGVFVANQAASGKGNWVQTLATIDRVESQSVAYHYTAGSRPQAAVAPLLPNDRYAANSKVLIYVNPADPSESILRLPSRPPQWPLLAGMLAVLFGASLALYFWRGPMPGLASQRARFIGRAQKVKNPARKAAPPMSRLRPPPPVVRKPDEDTDEA